MISFLAGLPRSGSTLFASILNQNPEIFVSSSSPVCNMLWECDKLWKMQIALKANPNPIGVQNVMSSIIPSFYADRKESLIIDKAFTWGTQPNLDLLMKYAPDEPLFVVMSRNEDDVIDSLTKLVIRHPHNHFDEGFVGERTYDALRKHVSESYFFAHCCESYKNILRACPEKCFVVDYKVLVSQPRQLLSDFYDFFSMRKYNHRLDRIENSNTDDDAVWGLPTMHEIKPFLQENQPISARR